MATITSTLKNRGATIARHLTLPKSISNETMQQNQPSPNNTSTLITDNLGKDYITVKDGNNNIVQLLSTPKSYQQDGTKKEYNPIILSFSNGIPISLTKQSLRYDEHGNYYPFTEELATIKNGQITNRKIWRLEPNKAGRDRVVEDSELNYNNGKLTSKKYNSYRNGQYMRTVFEDYDNGTRNVELSSSTKDRLQHENAAQYQKQLYGDVTPKEVHKMQILSMPNTSEKARQRKAEIYQKETWGDLEKGDVHKIQKQKIAEQTLKDNTQRIVDALNHRRTNIKYDPRQYNVQILTEGNKTTTYVNELTPSEKIAKLLIDTKTADKITNRTDQTIEFTKNGGKYFYNIDSKYGDLPTHAKDTGNLEFKHTELRDLTPSIVKQSPWQFIPGIGDVASNVYESAKSSLRGVGILGERAVTLGYKIGGIEIRRKGSIDEKTGKESEFIPLSLDEAQKRDVKTLGATSLAIIVFEHFNKIAKFGTTAYEGYKISELLKKGKYREAGQSFGNILFVNSDTILRKIPLPKVDTFEVKYKDGTTENIYVVGISKKEGKGIALFNLKKDYDSGALLIGEPKLLSSLKKGASLKSNEFTYIDTPIITNMIRKSVSELEARKLDIGQRAIKITKNENIDPERSLPEQTKHVSKEAAKIVYETARRTHAKLAGSSSRYSDFPDKIQVNGKTYKITKIPSDFDLHYKDLSREQIISIRDKMIKEMRKQGIEARPQDDHIIMFKQKDGKWEKGVEFLADSIEETKSAEMVLGYIKEGEPTKLEGVTKTKLEEEVRGTLQGQMRVNYNKGRLKIQPEPKRIKDIGSTYLSLLILNFL